MIDGAERDLFERGLRAATDQHGGAELDAALDDLGWHEARSIDLRTAVSLLFELQGLSCTTSGALDAVLAEVVLGPEAPAGVILPPIGRWSAPGVVDRSILVVEGLATAAGVRAERMLIVATRESDPREAAYLVEARDLERRVIEGLDPDLGLASVSLRSRVGEVVASTAWADAVRTAQLALGHELVGLSRRMLRLARDHALDRFQFGRPIASFQAVRHRLADAFVAIETANAAIDAGWLDGSPQSAAMAKALAGRGARTTARHCQQVLAGVGFTTEHPLHRSVRRVFVLDQLFGSSTTLTRALGDEIVATRRLPAFLPL